MIRRPARKDRFCVSGKAGRYHICNAGIPVENDFPLENGYILTLLQGYAVKWQESRSYQYLRRSDRQHTVLADKQTIQVHGGLSNPENCI